MDAEAQAGQAERWAESRADELVYFELDVLAAEGEYVARITLGGTRAPYRLRSLSGSETTVEALGLRMPAGFRLAPPSADPWAGLTKRQRAAFSAAMGADLTWESDIVLQPGEPLELRIPAARLREGYGFLDVCFQRADEGPGGGWIFKALPVGLGDPAAARRGMETWHAERRAYEAHVGPLPPLANQGGYGAARGHTTPFTGGRLPPRRPRAEG